MRRVLDNCGRHDFICSLIDRDVNVSLGDNIDNDIVINQEIPHGQAGLRGPDKRIAGRHQRTSKKTVAKKSTIAAKQIERWTSVSKGSSREDSGWKIDP